MKKQQIIVAGLGIIILFLFYFFASTTTPAKPANPNAASTNNTSQSLDIKAILEAEKAALSPTRQAYVNRLENAVVRGDVKDQQINAFHQLAKFWTDSVENNFISAAYYTAEASKLENSEKSLTFAAQLFLNNLRGRDNLVIKNWMTGESRDLFERALILNPNNDSARIGLGATYIFGSGDNQPENVMKGVQEILAVTKRDSLNMYAQLMLGLGGVKSGQYEKAIQRLLKVAHFDPGNLEAVLSLGEAYERIGDNTSAKYWYSSAKKITNDHTLIAAINERLEALK